MVLFLPRKGRPRRNPNPAPSSRSHRHGRNGPSERATQKISLLTLRILLVRVIPVWRNSPNENTHRQPRTLGSLCQLPLESGVRLVRLLRLGLDWFCVCPALPPEAGLGCRVSELPRGLVSRSSELLEGLGLGSHGLETRFRGPVESSSPATCDAARALRRTASRASSTRARCPE